MSLKGNLDVDKELLKTYRLFDEVEKELGEDRVKSAAATTIRLDDIIFQVGKLSRNNHTENITPIFFRT